MIKAIVFDLDGTLVDTIELHIDAWIKACKHLGITTTRESIANLIGLPAETIAKKLVRNSEEIIIRLIELKHMIYKQLLSQVKLYPDVLPTLTELKRRGFRIGIASSTSSTLLNRIISITGIKQYIDVAIGRDQVLKGKPDPEVFLKVFKYLGVNPNNGAIVGDTAYDIIPAKEIGALAILINRTNKGNNTMSCKADFVIDTLTDILKLLNDIDA